MSRAKNWCFTLNNYSDDHVTSLRSLASRCEYLVFGREVGDQGTPHLQGFVSFNERLRLPAVTELIPGAHVSVARFIVQSINYCKKDGDFEEYGTAPKGPGKRNDLDAFKESVRNGVVDMKVLREEHSHVCAAFPRFVRDYIEDHLPPVTVEAYPLRPWQQELNQMLLRPPCSRKIIFIVDIDGNSGKSWFCHYFSSLHDNCQVLLPGRKQDMAFYLSVPIRVLFVDAPRSKQGEYLQYDFLEDVKNGYVFSTKYESRIKKFDSPHVVVMMNERPDLTKLSADRYEIRVVS